MLNRSGIPKDCAHSHQLSLTQLYAPIPLLKCPQNPTPRIVFCLLLVYMDEVLSLLGFYSDFNPSYRLSGASQVAQW